MAGFLGRARFATLLAIALALLLTGVVAGAAGQAMIIGQSNDSGSSQTTLLTTASGASFTLKNSANSQTGQFGWSAGTAGAGRGLYGRADSPAGFGVDAWNNAATNGAGAALRARGALQVGVLATSDENIAVDATSASGSGVWGTGAGFAGGVVGDGEGSIAGLIGLGAVTDGTGWGVYASTFFEGGVGVYADSGAGTAVIGYGEGAVGLDDCGEFYCAGGSFSGDNGMLAETNAFFGYAVGAFDTGGSGYALWAEGDAVINGDLSVSSCTGCAMTSVAVNGSSQDIVEGDAVTLLGVSTAPDGSIALVVGPAKQDDAVLGIAATAIKRVTKAEAATTTRTLKVKGAGGKLVDKAITSTTSPAKGQAGKWLDGGARTAPEGYLRVVTSGLFAYDGAVSAEVGDRLAVGAKAGKLGKADAEASAAGKYLGKLKDGRTVVLVDPS